MEREQIGNKSWDLKKLSYMQKHFTFRNFREFISEIGKEKIFMEMKQALPISLIDQCIIKKEYKWPT
ncbi:hypothetical protein LEP1GSC137_0076 [Leptospira borgpetersenii str. Noumea 25]|nr:Uncharacterized protein LB4E_3364 [Leptospira borgpetersenii str. 4E]EKR01098.1 hypothetical protein LEP1GSC121_1385 [Leptospira borgpetersenii serovar Castellonis str. 200801910]EMO10093.1 hypothetical protein LEP1GSC137_0076 [Leptospira borgpetersenii str. Noumea 25]